MQENNPEKLHTPEAGQEFYDASQQAETKSFRPDYADDKLAKEVEEKVLPPTKKEETPSEVHHEAGVPLKLVYRSEKEMAEAVTNLINSPPDTGKPGVANDLQKQMEQMLAQENPENLDKAA